MPYCKFMLSLPPRLQTVASLVRKGSFVADVGTDHAYLPIWLAENNMISGAVATDIAIGPLDRALRNIKSSNLPCEISTALTPGLLGIDKYAPDDICICGMGSETIIQILEASEYVNNSNVRLILQPMTKAEFLREWLLENGFFIADEKLCYDRDKLYQIIVAQYHGEKSSISEYAALVGTDAMKSSEHYKLHLQNILKMQNKKFEGLKVSGADTAELEVLIRKLEQEIIGYDNGCGSV